MDFIKLDLLLGGLGIFLFGIKYMGDGLKALAGDRLRDIIDKYTSSPVKGILIGTLVTVLIQSSSATTALAIGLIRSGLMTLTQAVGIIMGANIGTTITAVLIGLNISDYALYILAFGAFFVAFSQNKKRSYLGQTIFGFGALFVGLTFMGDALSTLKESPLFLEYMDKVALNPFLGLLIGLVLTLLIQSSSAVVGILQVFYGSGTIALGAALPALFGSNIGTTITAILAALGGSVSAKRAAGIHVMFNIIGSVLFMIILYPFTQLVVQVGNTFNLSPEMQLAFAHAVFNISTALLLFPFINHMVNLIKKIIPGNEFEIDVNLEELNSQIVHAFPSHALEIAQVKAINMGDVTLKMLQRTKTYINAKKDTESLAKINQYEETVNLLDAKISSYLMEIAQEKMNEQDSQQYFAILQALKDFERIGDHCLNLAEYFENIRETSIKPSEGAMEDINKMLDLVIEMTEESNKYFESKEEAFAETVRNKEHQLDRLNHKSRQRHIERVSLKEEKSPVVSSLFVDIISNIERMGDHCTNIVSAIQNYD